MQRAGATPSSPAENILLQPPIFSTPPPQSTLISQNENGELCRVGLKPTPFWPDRPALWFAHLEGQFLLARINCDSTKFYHVCGQLDRQHIIEVEDIIENPPKENMYATLKAELIRRLSATQEQNVKQLLEFEELGSRKPS
ncbi:uncharacterized protein LOC131843363 [Achroia grisella]|uniref:uncharacterized protein LOC131843363 n=1 Tax=Achroia grisella TaxID=688607 RepID=UPI0027D2572C|nr:uncharacterized protein LOC131843363 [Achroia grisella]